MLQPVMPDVDARVIEPSAAVREQALIEAELDLPGIVIPVAILEGVVAVQAGVPDEYRAVSARGGGGVVVVCAE